MRSRDEIETVGRLVATGLNDCAISRTTGIPRSTVREWRVLGPPGPFPGVGGCRDCNGPEHDFGGLPASYVYLLGLYLGDGCLSAQARGVFRLRIVLDSRYPGIVRECARAMSEVLPTNRAHVQPKHGENAVEVGVSSKQLPCLFPQHGPGRKHRRLIALVAWQQELVEKWPGLLIRGLIHSDGCRSINTVRHAAKKYRYPRYSFPNRSDDIRGIFCDACDLVGVEWRVMNRWNISVARRESVARLDEFVGPKT